MTRPYRKVKTEIPTRYCRAHCTYCEVGKCLCKVHNEYGCFDYEYEEDGETEKIICTKDRVYSPIFTISSLPISVQKSFTDTLLS